MKINEEKIYFNYCHNKFENMTGFFFKRFGPTLTPVV